MKYLLKSGVFYGENGNMLCRLRNVLFCSEKWICDTGGEPVLQVQIRQKETVPEQRGDVRSRTYVLQDLSGKEIALANPDYAQGEDPLETGWPVCRAPRADHAALRLQEREYVLTMHNCQNYTMTDDRGTCILQVLHRGIAGGWTIDTELQEMPEVLCGLFVFCRYLEQENELMMV